MKTKSTITVMREYLSDTLNCELTPRLKVIADGFKGHQKAPEVNECLEASKLQPLNVRILPEAVAIFCLNNSLIFDQFAEYNTQAHEMRAKKLLEDDTETIQLLREQLLISQNGSTGRGASLRLSTLRSYVEEYPPIMDASSGTTAQLYNELTYAFDGCSNVDIAFQQFISTNLMAFRDTNETTRRILAQLLLEYIDAIIEDADMAYLSRKARRYKSTSDQSGSGGWTTILIDEAMQPENALFNVLRCYTAFTKGPVKKADLENMTVDFAGIARLLLDEYGSIWIDFDDSYHERRLSPASTAESGEILAVYLRNALYGTADITRDLLIFFILFFKEYEFRKPEIERQHAVELINRYLQRVGFAMVDVSLNWDDLCPSEKIAVLLLDPQVNKTFKAEIDDSVEEEILDSYMYDYTKDLSIHDTPTPLRSSTLNNTLRRKK